MSEAVLERFLGIEVLFEFPDDLDPVWNTGAPRVVTHDQRRIADDGSVVTKRRSHARAKISPPANA